MARTSCVRYRNGVEKVMASKAMLQLGGRLLMLSSQEGDTRDCIPFATPSERPTWDGATIAARQRNALIRTCCRTGRPRSYQLIIALPYSTPNNYTRELMSSQI